MVTSKFSALCVATASLSVLLLAGCGIGPSATSAPADVSAAKIQGNLYGGPSPIVGATVKVYTTGNADGTNGGYGVATFRQEAAPTNATYTGGGDTDSAGDFTFAGGYTCPSGQLAYIVSSGGKTGSYVTNNAVVQVAALGRCEDLYSGTTYTGTFVFINELSTVAAAYALGNFSAVSFGTTGNASTAKVLIGAPASNNSAYTSGGYSTGCVATFPAGCTTTASAGLLHAFENAANLDNVFYNNAGGPTAPATILNSASNNMPIVPAQLINSIANSMVACTNSNNTPSTACTTFLAAGGPSGTPATDTFSAAKYFASNPALTGAGATVTQVVNNCVGVTCVYTPTLGSSVPNDLSIGIVYPKGTGAGTSRQGTTYTLGIALDMDDNLYVGNTSAAPSTANSGNLLSFASDGAILTTTPTAGNNALKNPYTLALDAAGDLYVTSYAFSTYPLVRWTANLGSITTSTNFGYASGGTACATCGTGLGVAADKLGNAWLGTSKGIFYELPAGSASGTLLTTPATAATTDSVLSAIEVDPDQNVWGSDVSVATNTNVTILRNTGTDNSTGAAHSGTLTTFTSPLTSSVVFGTGSPFTAVGIASSSTANSAGTYNSGEYKVALTISTDAITAATAGATTGTLTDFKPTVSAIDGSNTIFSAAANTTPSLIMTPSPYTANSGRVLEPCYYVSSACTDAFGTSAANHVVIDSTGSIWTENGAGGTLVQIIGSAVPAVPLISLGLTGKP